MERNPMIPKLKNKMPELTPRQTRATVLLIIRKQIFQSKTHKQATAKPRGLWMKGGPLRGSIKELKRLKQASTKSNFTKVYA